MDPHHSKDDRDMTEVGDVHAVAEPSINDNFYCRLVRVVDGDTVELDVDLRFYNRMVAHFRLASVNTPEARGVERAAGRWVTEQVKEFLGGPGTDMKIDSKECKLGKFGRGIVDLWKINGQCLNVWLLNKGYAWPTDEDGKIIGPRDIERLAIPDGVKQQVREAMS